jgi:hypothetical protein
MYVTNIRSDLQDTRQLLFRAKTEVHRFDADSLGAMCGEGIGSAESVQAEARRALEEYRFRRNGLVAATLLISVFALSLWRKIRALERRQAAA